MRTPRPQLFALPRGRALALLLIGLLAFVGCASDEPPDEDDTNGATSTNNGTNTNNSSTGTSTNSSTSTNNSSTGTNNGTSTSTNNGTSTSTNNGTTTPPDVCDPNPCDAPDPAECDGDTLIMYAERGTCSERAGQAVCDYAESTRDCADDGLICVQGACVAEGIGRRPLPGEVVITEIMYNPAEIDDNDGEWVELFNTTGEALDLSLCALSDDGDNSTQLDGVLVEPGAFAVLARSSDPAVNGGFEADGGFDFGLGNQGDAVILRCGDTLIDEVVYDDGGAFPAASGASLNLDPNRVNPDENDDGDFWCLGTVVYYEGAESNAGTPGGPNTICADVQACDPNPCFDPPDDFCAGDVLTTHAIDGVCTDQNGLAVCDYSPEQVNCADDGLICQNGRCIEPEPTGTPPAAGEVIITEIMYNPADANDDDAEYIELTNISGAERDLGTCVVKDDPADPGSPLTGVSIASNGFVLIARSSEPSLFGGAVPDATFNFGLNNGGDSVIFECGGVVIDTVTYDDGGDFPEATGASLNLNPDFYDADANDSGANWCLSSLDFGGNDLGSPAALNAACAPPDDVCDPNPCFNPPSDFCDGDIAVSYAIDGVCTDVGGVASCDYAEERIDCFANDDVCEAGACVPDDVGEGPLPGEIVITEIMYNPTTFDDNDAEYIELTQTSFGPRDLSRCVLKDSPDAAGSPLTGIIINTGQTVLIGRSDDPAFFGGVTPAATFNFNLNNGGDAVIFECEGEVLDRVDYDDGGAFPAATGASLSLDPGIVSPDDNDDGGNWCLGQTDYGEGNLGTPGAGNTPCNFNGGTCPIEPLETITGPVSLQANSVDSGDDFEPVCTASLSGNDNIWALSVGSETTVCANTDGSTDIGEIDTVLYVRTSCTDDATDLDCNDDYNGDIHFDSQVEFIAQPGNIYYLIVDGLTSTDNGDQFLNVAFGPCP